MIIKPSLLLDFANSRQLPAGVTFSRASTATYFDALGVLRTAEINAPRFDHDPATGLCRGLLMEEARTNLYINSEVCTAASKVAVTANAVTAPDGQTTADLVVDDATAGEHYTTDRSVSVTAGTYYTFSAFVKPGSAARNLLLRVAGLNAANVYFNSVTGSIEAASGSSYVSSGAQQLPGGWWRVTMVINAVSTGATLFRLQLASGIVNSYTGDGASGAYVWGAQLEAGAYATSYIPTAGASVTRALDAAAMTGASFSSWYRQDEGTFVVAAAMAVSTSDTAPRVVYGVGDPSFSFATGEMMYLNRAAGSALLLPAVLDGGAPQFSAAAATVADKTPFRQAFAYKTNDFASCTNGGTVATDTAGSLPTPTLLAIGGQTQLWAGGGAGAMNGTVAQLAYFPKRLTNAELQGLTS